MLSSFGLGRSMAGRGVIFTLHHVRPHVSRACEPNRHLEITPQFLDEAITAVLEDGYLPIALSQLPDWLKNGDPSRPVAIFTLDDGYRDNAIHAAPVFARHDVPYTIFVARGLTERTHTLWWETAEALVNATSEIDYDFGNGVELVEAATPHQKLVAFKRIAASIVGGNEAEAVVHLDEQARIYGVNADRIVRDLVMDRKELQTLVAQPLAHLGSHTISHRAMAYLNREAAIDEMTASAIYVTGITGRRNRVFAYPYGLAETVSKRDRDLALECGFDIAVTTSPGTLTARALADMGALPRVSLNGFYQKARYVKALASGIPFKLLN
ncbi:MAG TPA: polysaccharide deacetylase family protein [Ensifer sp.]|nr:polysaccharide deacetylase family protein [Ensifer sp.]